MTDAPAKRGPIGFARPPKEHQFTKGRSGNPQGRPPKDKTAKQRSAAHTQLEDIVLAEALRPIQIRENDQVLEMPMIQAVIRSMGVAAVKGSHKAQTTLTDMVQAVQAKRYEEMVELAKTAIEYKEAWRATFEEYDRRGEPRPEPVPHPDEIVVDFATLAVKFNGPISDEDKANWDMMLKRRKQFLEEIDYLRKEIKKPKNKRYVEIFERDIAHDQYIADMLGGVIPDEQTRRRPGFDIDKWRARNGVLAALQKKRRRLSAKPKPTQ